MTTRAIIFDLDNTLYAVSSIAQRLFAPLFQLLSESNEVTNELNEVKEELMRIPFQTVAKKNRFSEGLTQKGIQLLANLVYEGPIEPFPDYSFIKALPLQKYLVTSGFEKMQHSKVKRMGIADDFREIHIVDIGQTTKKTVFADILARNELQAQHVMVIGDDPDSEIKAAQELGIPVLLYDKTNRFPNAEVPKISDYSQLQSFLT